MGRYFNTEGCCYPDEHYMVNLDSRLKEIKSMVDAGKYFTINRGRQYVKTTILKALRKYLSDDYIVVSLDFQLLSSENYESADRFVRAFSGMLYANTSCRKSMSESVLDEILKLKQTEKLSLGDLFFTLSDWCGESDKPVVLMIDD